MRGLGSASNLRFLHFDKISNTGLLPDVGIHAQPREGSHGRAFTNKAVVDHRRVLDHYSIADRNVLEPAPGVNRASGTNRTITLDDDLRVNRGVRTDAHLGVNVSGGGIEKRDSREHELTHFFLPQFSFKRRQLNSGVYASNLVYIVVKQNPDAATSSLYEAGYIGQVILALRIVGREPVEGGDQRLNLKAVNAHVDFSNREVFRPGILLLDRALKPTALVAHDSSVVCRVFHLDGENGSGIVISLVVVYEVLQGRSLNKRYITREHH